MSTGSAKPAEPAGAAAGGFRRAKTRARDVMVRPITPQQGSTSGHHGGITRGGEVEKATGGRFGYTCICARWAPNGIAQFAENYLPCSAARPLSWTCANGGGNIDS